MIDAKPEVGGSDDGKRGARKASGVSAELAGDGIVPAVQGGMIGAGGGGGVAEEGVAVKSAVQTTAEEEAAQTQRLQRKPLGPKVRGGGGCSSEQ